MASASLNLLERFCTPIHAVMATIEYSGALDAGYDAAALKAVAQRLLDIVALPEQVGTLRLTVGSLAFVTGQALLDWLRATNQTFNAARVSQTVAAAAP